MIRCLRIFALLTILAIVPAARALSAEKPHFARLVEIHGSRLTLRGTSLLRVGYVFRVYWAALYVGEGIPTDRVLEDVPKRLEIVYLRKISAKDIVRAGNEILQRQTAPDQLEAIRSRVDQINAVYRSVRPGDRYTLTYVPGVGSDLTLNGEWLARIPGADFARHYFGIWLDPRNEYREFRAALMGSD
ncbi:MAG: chalcone isomerase family protein [Kiritimatiellae bacterium]|nr:chalcone isomerase family protein [Kiritimatiellia bacterium]MDW8457549.1 chalcone isomerase family protein [Verrucomicrobiota bacterium]